jgi:hypothetical protein
LNKASLAAGIQATFFDSRKYEKGPQLYFKLRALL